MAKIINTPLTPELINDLMAGDRVFLNGIIYTGRDAAHKRLAELIEKGEELPMDIKNQTIYYVGPCPAKPGQVIGSAGPTTSGRMDSYAPLLMEHGLKGMIGKGIRNQQVVDSIIKYNAVYFAAIGGAGALLSEAIKEAEVIAFPDLGAEAIYKLRVENFPVIVIIDNKGNDLYKLGKEKYKIV
ncbi:MAG: Fe-S-containing hydro-lyase [Tissierellia bacterium]|jgi:fumarate hydratase subunit beta|nr:Fe-S-containing hydro-lyase [Sedimentibacter sp.]NLA14752.1 Fe-S-containing hydro-lyase [Tissierellia bacterium]HOA20775.1 Fe-S-containing hydro-lyase [Sedimentibacter sp.]HPB80203.1 Fe-S-containing hydro-lyase [Sedimentibacter sp.]HQO72635.1 Fe-S-containing hydro-lyase [Sedimentibacter sp.]